MRAVVLMGSPRRAGRGAAGAAQVADGLRAQGYDEVRIIDVAALSVAGCRGCEACARPPAHACVIRDDMDTLLPVLDAADVLAVVAPVYFAGPPAQLKAVLDRLQPHFWRGTRTARPKRPARLYVVGDGGDPHGFGPLVTIVRSALAVAGFRVEQVRARIGAAAEQDYDFGQEG